MKKIPTLFERDPEDRAHVLPNVTPGCEWVIEGEGVATRKYDGTCMKFDGQWWGRREVKPGKQPPAGFVEEGYDDTTGKTVGWVLVDSTWSFVAAWQEAVQPPHRHGTYELCGPKINGNPEGYDHHLLIPHGEFVIGDAPRDFDGLADYLTHDFPFEGIVWHHSDGRMAKLKKRDFS